MLDLTLWRDRLVKDVPVMRSFGLAADLAAVKKGLRVTPQAFIVPISDLPAQSPGFGNATVSQNIKAIVAIVIALSNQRGANVGSSASADIQAVRSAIMSSLVGWQPTGASHAIEFAGGRSLDFADSTVWFSDRYTTSYFVRKEFSS